MDVTGPLFYGIPNDEIHHFHKGGVLHILNIGFLFCFIDVRFRQELHEFLAAEFIGYLADGLLRVIVFLKDLQDMGCRGNGRLDVITRNKLKVLHHVQIQGIGHGDVKDIVFQGYGDTNKFARNFFGDGPYDIALDLVLTEIHIGDLQLHGQGKGHLLLGYDFHVNQGLAQALSRLFLCLQSLYELILGQKTGFNQQLTQLAPGKGFFFGLRTVCRFFVRLVLCHGLLIPGSFFLFPLPEDRYYKTQPKDKA